MWLDVNFFFFKSRISFDDVSFQSLEILLNFKHYKDTEKKCIEK